MSGGAAIPGEILREVEERFGVLLLEGYGLSESCATATFNRSREDRRFLSIGKPIWGVEVRVVDDNRQSAAPREPSTSGSWSSAVTT